MGKLSDFSKRKPTFEFLTKTQIDTALKQDFLRLGALDDGTQWFPHIESVRLSFPYLLSANLTKEEKALLALYPKSWVYKNQIQHPVLTKDLFYSLACKKKESLYKNVLKEAKETIEKIETGKHPNLNLLIKMVLLIAIGGENWKVIDLVLASNLSTGMKITLLKKVTSWSFKSRIQTTTNLMSPSIFQLFYSNQKKMKDFIQDLTGTLIQRGKYKKDFPLVDGKYDCLLGKSFYMSFQEIKGERGVVTKLLNFHLPHPKEREDIDFFKKASQHELESLPMEKLVSAAKQYSGKNKVVVSYMLKTFKRVKHIPECAEILKSVIQNQGLSLISPELLSQTWNSSNLSFSEDALREEVLQVVSSFLHQNSNKKVFIKGSFN